jgi:hypothetical protein
MTPEIEAAVERHTAHMLALRSHYTKAANGLANQIRDGSLSRKDGTAKIRELWLNHVAQVRLGEASLPDPTGKVTELVTNCPWCGKLEAEVEVATLPDNVVEPPFSLAKLVAQAQASTGTSKRK